MGNGRRVEPQDAQRRASEELLVEFRSERTRCREKCKGKRSNTESPAILVPIYEGGERKRVLICTCCEQALKLDSDGLGAPAIDPALIEGKHRRFVCNDCAYNVVLLAELKPA